MLAVKVTLVPGHIVPAGLAVTITDGLEIGTTIILIALDVALAGLTQAALDAMITVTTSPFCNVDVVNVEELVPAFTPLICHWYPGLLPPFVAVAVNVTDVPAQIGPDGTAVIFTEAVTGWFTVMVILFDVAVDGLVQGALEVMITVITSPFCRLLLVYVVLLVPTLLPFSCH